MSLPTTPPRVMRGANGSVAGASGYPPIPAAADNVKYLKGDGTWSSLSNASAATNAEAAAGTSTTTFVTPANAGIAVAGARNALAPAQALSGNGTATFGTATLASSLGATAHTIALRLSVPAAQQSGFILTLAGNGNAPFNDLYCYLSAGSLVVNYRFASLDHVTVLSSGFVTAYGGTTVDLQLVFDGTNALAYVNSVLVSTTALAVNLTGATALALGSSTWVGTTRLLGIENRALSAAEVLANYRSGGAWPSADYGAPGVPASNTTLITTDQVRNNTGAFFTAPGVLFSGTAMVLDAGEYAFKNGVVTVGKKYRAVITIDAITAGFLVVDNAVSETFATYGTAGVKTIEFTPTVNGVLDFYAAGGAVTITDIALYPIGLVCAPEANAPGNGYQWKDASGNMADITLPSSGVAWALPDTRPNSVRERVTWAGTHERKYLLGAERAFPEGSLITDITTKASVASSGTGLSIGTFNDGSRWVAANAFTTAKKVHTLANRMPASDAAADHNLNIDPDSANFTGYIDVEVRYVVTKGTQ